MDIADWLHGLGLARYEEVFRDNAIDVETLPDLTERDLEKLSVLLGHRKRMLRAAAARAAGSPLPTRGLSSGTAAGVNLLADEHTVRPRAPPRAGEERVGAEAERRQLTVMFCDLVSSTVMASRLDPEDLRAVIAAYHRAVADVVRSFDGFIAKYMDEGVLIYFGYPQAHEDDVERAVRAGLGLIDAVGRLDVKSAKLQARIGIATGLVVVGDLIGEGSAQEHSVVGETPNLAARLQTLAEPGAVVIAAGTRWLIGDLFEVRDLGAIAVKGIAAPVPVWQVLRPGIVASRFEALRSGETPLVGRGEELDLLLRRWAQAGGGEGRVVLLSGEPGIGKSRLTVALQERIRSEPHTRLRYFCSPHHQDSTLYPIIGQLEHAAGFAHDDAPAVRLEKLTALLGPEIGESDLVLIAELLSLPLGERFRPLDLGPQRKKELILAALARQLDNLVRREPVLIVFEDLHWSDPTSRELLDHLVGRIERLPVLLITTHRPEFDPHWVGLPQVTARTLNRLERADGTLMVRQLAGETAALPAEIIDDIIERTDGVPLFIEELTKAVVESGAGRSRETLSGIPAASHAVPATLQASLLARLDRLGPSAKQVGQIGAAIGREFSHELLAAVAQLPGRELDQALHRLVAAGLVFQRGLSPASNYLFKHALVQDTAYSTLLRGPRQALHARIGHALEERFPAIVEAQPDVAARHFTEAGLLDKAVAYWARAGRQSVAKSALVEGMTQLHRALELTANLPDASERQRHRLDCRITLAFALLAAKGYAHPEVTEAFGRAAALLADAEGGDPMDRFSVLYGLFANHHVRGDTPGALASAREFHLLAEAQKLSAPRLVGHRVLGTALMMSGDYGAALPHFEEAVALYAPSEHRPLAMRLGQDIGVSALVMGSWAWWHCGYPDRADRAVEQGVRYAREAGHAHTLCHALFAAGMTAAFARRWAALEALTGQCRDIAERHGFPMWGAWGRLFRGLATGLRGAADAAEEDIRAGIDLWQASGARIFDPFFLGLQAEVCAAAGRIEQGLVVLVEAFAISAEGGQIGFDAELYRLRGELLRRSPDPDPAAIEACFCEAVTVAREQGARSYELRAAASLARLWRDQGHRAAAHDLLAPVYGWFTEGFDTPDLKAAKARLDELG